MNAEFLHLCHFCKRAMEFTNLLRICFGLCTSVRSQIYYILICSNRIRRGIRATSLEIQRATSQAVEILLRMLQSAVLDKFGYCAEVATGKS